MTNSSTFPAFVSKTASDSIECVFNAFLYQANYPNGGPTGTGIAGIWLYDSTNSIIYSLHLTIQSNDGAITPQWAFSKWTYAGTGQPVFSVAIGGALFHGSKTATVMSKFP